MDSYKATGLKISTFFASLVLTGVFGIAVLDEYKFEPNEIPTIEQAKTARFDSAIYRLGLKSKPGETIYERVLPITGLIISGVALIFSLSAAADALTPAESDTYQMLPPQRPHCNHPRNLFPADSCTVLSQF